MHKYLSAERSRINVENWNKDIILLSRRGGSGMGWQKKIFQGVGWPKKNLGVSGKHYFGWVKKLFCSVMAKFFGRCHGKYYHSTSENSFATLPQKYFAIPTYQKHCPCPKKLPPHQKKLGTPTPKYFFPPHPKYFAMPPFPKNCHPTSKTFFAIPPSKYFSQSTLKMFCHATPNYFAMQKCLPPHLQNILPLHPKNILPLHFPKKFSQIFFLPPKKIATPPPKIFCHSTPRYFFCPSLLWTPSTTAICPWFSFNTHGDLSTFKKCQKNPSK